MQQAPRNTAVGKPAARKTAARKAATRERAASERDGLSLINAVLRPDGAPVLGLYIYTASFALLKSLAQNPKYRDIKPHLIGTPAILAALPGISQAELADYMGAERATVGLQVKACIALGWVRRTVADDDRRRYVLDLTAAGRKMLAAVIPVVARHEAEFGAGLSARERETLRKLLAKLIGAARQR